MAGAYDVGCPARLLWFDLIRSVSTCLSSTPASDDHAFYRCLKTVAIPHVWSCMGVHCLEVALQ